MREGVTYKPFDTCFDKFKVPKGIPAKEYKETGLFPIVSQEEEFISGYWDGEDKLVKIPRPVVIFGDHSRAVKYVDFDFVLGADGVKVLLPKTCFNAKYIYYFLKHYNVPSLGYSRHFKLLHEAEIPELSLSSQ
jgi:type I restriction enzyme S subunit